MQYALVFLPGLVFGRLFDIGYFRLPFAIASSVLVACTFLVAECTQYWHFMLCQGLAIGVRFALLQACFPVLTPVFFDSYALVFSSGRRWVSSGTGSKNAALLRSRSLRSVAQRAAPSCQLLSVD